MRRLRGSAAALGLMWAASGAGHAQEMSALDTARIGVDTLLETVAASRPYFLSDRERYNAAVGRVLATFIDFGAVADVVMSRHAARASPAQRRRFAGILRDTLTRFYGAALASYDGEELVFLPPRDSGADPRADTVVSMELRGANTLVLQYQMFLNDSDEWKLKNLRLGGINLGRQYNAQFMHLMSTHGGDIDAVLDDWR